MVALGVVAIVGAAITLAVIVQLCRQKRAKGGPLLSLKEGQQLYSEDLTADDVEEAFSADPSPRDAPAVADMER